MIERGFTRLIQHGDVIHGLKERAYLPCGCSAAFGIRFDNHDAVMDVFPCSPEHEPMMRRFHALYTESLAAPQARPAVEVADELLAQAAAG